METEWDSTYLPSFPLAVPKLHEREGLHRHFIPSRTAEALREATQGKISGVKAKYLEGKNETITVIYNL